MDKPYRNLSSGGFQGNHRTHMDADATPLTCTNCHPGSSDYSSSHSHDSKNKIKVSSNINASPHPDKATYKNTTSAWPQTSTPDLGTCSNVNCHFEATTPTWGSDPALTTCTTCHGVPPVANYAPYGGGANGSHGVHKNFYPGVNNCIKCHPDHTVESKPFAHATSIGNRQIAIRLRDPLNNVFGSFSSGTRDYLPSQVVTHTYGSCNNTYCHSTVQADGGVGQPAYGTPTWGADLSTCNSTCHDVGGITHNTTPTIATGSHARHLVYSFDKTSNPITNCTTCHHWPSVPSATTCSGCHIPHGSFGAMFYPELFTKHANGLIDVAFNPSFSNGTYNGSPVPRSGYDSCSNTYCHSDGTSVAAGSVPANTSPTWGTGTMACSGCHGNPPAYANGSPKANSHTRHNFGCNSCHNITTSDGIAITNTQTHVNQAYNVDAGAGASFSYIYNSAGGTCTSISCHGNTSAQWGGIAGCLVCHSVAQGSRAAITSQFGSGNSHHIQGAVTDDKCYQCHWEANNDGTINQTYHNAAVSGAAVRLVIYSTLQRPKNEAKYFIAYTANGKRTQIQKINNHCLGCHNEQNNAIIPFGDGNTPKQYAWDNKSVDARYSQMGTTTWGKYTSSSYPNAAKKKIAKAFSAHGNSASNQRGWDTSSGVDGTITSTGGTVSVQCFDCHNSHGSTAAGITSRYSSATGRNRGAILKNTVASQGGYALAYKPYTSGSTANKNRLNPGAGLCLDCHLSQNAATTPWGYNSTFGATKPILGYWDALSYNGYSTSGSRNRYSFKGKSPVKGGHFGASSPLSGAPMSTIDGLCTPCHDPHGVSPTLGANQQYAVPLLKGTWITSPYKEDTAPTTNAKFTNRTDLGNEGVQYHIDQNTFGSGLITAVTGITQTENQSEGLCLGCHQKSSLTDGVTHDWKSKDRIHESVKGWKTADATIKHNYSCSKCHSPHTNATLPRLMVTNCLDSQHKGRTSWAPAKTSDSGYGEFLLNVNQSLHKCTELPASYGWCDISNWPNGGRGGGHIPGNWSGTRSAFRDKSVAVACHESQTASATDQSWNEITPWGFYPPITVTDPSSVVNGLQATITWSTNIPGSSRVNYGLTSSYGSTTTDPAFVLNHSLTLTGLTNHSIHHYQVNSIASDGKDITSADYTLPYISQPPTVPVLVGKANGVCESSCSVTLQLNASTDPDNGPIEYQVQVDTSGSFNTGNLQTSTWTSGTSWSPNLATNSTWYWRAQARDAGHITAQDPTSGWSATGSFILLTGVPAAPTIGAPSALSAAAIRWNFTDYANNEVGFKLHDSSNDSLKASGATANLTYLDETGLTANTRYTRHVHAYNAQGDSSASADVSRYTLSVTPNVTANKTTSTWYATAGVTFTNAAGFGSGGVQYYRYAWDQNPTHVFNDNEAPWTGSTLMMTANATGRWYLHVKGYNGDDLANGTQDYGPYYYDITPPTGVVNATPANGALYLPVSTNIYATSATDNDSGQVQYWFQVSTENTFPVDPAKTKESVWQAGTGFAPALVADTTYYWHVKAKDALGNATAYTPATWFKTTPNSASWTNKGDFENNVSTNTAATMANPATTRTQVEVSGTNPTDNAAVIIYLTRISSIASGGYHSLALREDGSVWAWGNNQYGRLGIGIYGYGSYRATPVQVSGLGPVSGSNPKVIAIAAGAYNSVALKSDGSVWNWGDDYGTTPQQVSGLAPAGEVKVVAVAAGSSHFLALKSDGSVWAWGRNNWYGQIGDGTTTTRSTPVQVSGLGPVTGSDPKVISIAAGDDHSMALKSDGSVFTWGSNNGGQLGDGTQINKSSPYLVFAPGSTVVALQGGYETSQVIKSDGSVWGWGYNYYGEIGNGTTNYSFTPVQASGLGPVTGSNPKVIAAATGWYHTLAVKDDGSVWIWGKGYGATPSQLLPPGSGISAVSAGFDYSIATNNSHNALAWGRNDYGQLGTGDTTNLNTPTQNLFYGIYTSGTISGLRLDSGSTNYWGAISWNGATPVNTSIRFRTRGAGSEAGLASATWSPYITSSGSAINTSPSQWLEVELTEQTSDGIFTPTLDDVTVTYATNPIPLFVSSFTATSPSTSWIIPITSFTASNSSGGGITGYLITTSATPPAAGDAGWSGNAPGTYTVTADGTYSLYPWAKNAAGNVSAVFGSPVSVNVDATRPSVTAFAAASPSAGNITITAFTATDNIGVTGYLITTSATPPAAGAAGWSGSAPATYTVAAEGTYTLYPWVRDAAGNVSAAFGSPASVNVVGIDTAAPLVWSFTAASASGTLVVPVYSFTASDNAGVTGYLITTSAIPPTAGTAGWSGTPPATYTLPGSGTYLLYPWAKDAAGNVSAIFGSPVSVSVDTTRPSVAAFTASPPSGSRNITIASFTATDNISVAGYLITTSSTPPSSGDTGWSVSAPTTYTVAVDGRYILYPWAKDTAGNVSSVFGSPATVIVDASAAVSANDGFNPNANNTVYAIAVQEDGKIVIGGSFTTVGGVARNRIARLNTNGTIDSSFNPDLNNYVKTIVIQADGKILIGGQFTTVTGITRNSITRLNADGSLDNSFNPNVSWRINTLAVQGDGKIVIGGAFNTVGGTTRNNIARLNPDGSVDNTFNPNANDDVSALAVQPDGKIVIGGNFTTIAGIGRYSIARLNADGTLDTSFTATTVNGTNYVNSVAIQSDGKILIGGYFSAISGTSRSNIARLNADGTLDTSFSTSLNSNDPVYSFAVKGDGKILFVGSFNTVNGTARASIAQLNTDGSLDGSFNANVNTFSPVNSIAIQGDGKILIGGSFSTVGGYTRNNFARLKADGSLDNFFDPNPNSNINAIATEADGKVLIGGAFTTVSGTAHNYIARLDSDGALVASFNPNANSNVNAIAVQTDGKIVIGGQFMTVGGVTRNRIARLNTDGGLDTTFDPNASAVVNAIAVQADGKIVIGGSFTTIGGVTRNCIARLNTDGSLDTSFNPNLNGPVYSLAVQTGGKIMIGGSFSTVGGVARTYIARLNADGSLDNSFNPSVPNNVITFLAIQADGKIAIGGTFTTIGAATRNRIARLNSDGNLDTSCDPNVNNYPYTLAIQADGKIVIGGLFTNVGGTTRNRIARLNADCSVDTSFDPNANNTVNAVAIQADGKIIMGGQFSTVGGYTRNYIARLTSSDNTIQSLAASADGTSVTWLRSGTVPEVEMVTFERSSDMSTWTLLGSGTRISGGWQLTGLSLPVGQNYIRARGTARGGYSTGSSSLIESVMQTYNTNMSVTAFTATSPSPSKDIPITLFTASNSGGITGYMVTSSPTPPTAWAVGWSSTPPATYAATVDGAYSLYPWAKDAYDNVSPLYGSPAAVIVDASPPSVAAFSATSPSASRNIPISTFTAISGGAVTGYLITTSSTRPAAEAAGWSGSAPATFVVASDGTYTLYPWVKDAAGNVSTPFASPVPVSVDTGAPSVTAFTATSPAATRNIAITTFTANDNLGAAGITGYLITTSSTPPTTGAAGWSATAPTTYTVAADGAYTLYPWVRNVVGYVSPVFGPVSVTVTTPDTILPQSHFTSLPASGGALNGATAGGASYIITGTATDDRGIQNLGIEVSTDGGSTWHASTCTGCPGASVTWQYDWQLPADGVYHIMSRATDTSGNVEAPVADNVITLDRTAPTVSIGSPSTTTTHTGPVTFTVTYTGANVVTLANADVTLNKTGTADGIVAVTGGGTGTRTITISGISGNGTLGIGIASGTASDTAGNSAAAAGSSILVTVDSAVPTLSIGEPSATLTNNRSITYTVNYTGATTVTLANTDVTLNRTGTANGTIAVTGSGTATRTVTVSGINGNGTLGIGIAAGTATNAGGASAAVAGPSSTFNVDNVAPTGQSNSAPTSGTTGLLTATTLNCGVANDSGGGAVQYYFQIALDSGFSSGVQTRDWQPETSYAPTLVAGTTYYWRVKARDAALNETPYTSPSSFRTMPSSVTWTNQGDFENNAATNVLPITMTTPVTTGSQVQVSGANPVDDAAVIIKPIRYSTLSSRYAHTLALKTDGTVWAWGYNIYGQLGDNSTTNRATPVQVTGLAGVIAVAAGESHSLALKSDGTVWGWGRNAEGQLGDTTTTFNYKTPIQVQGGLTGVIAIAAGDLHSMALKSDGSVWTWGNNVTTPTQVSGVTDVITVAAGRFHSLAVKSDGTVLAWGSNDSGQLGDGTNTSRTNPAPVSGLTRVIAIAADWFGSMALKSDGTVWAWGNNATTPVQVSGITDVIAVAAGNYEMALKSDGSVWAWGDNTHGQLGNGSTTSTSIPAQIPSLGSGSGITAITAGSSGFSQALKSDGSVLAWGNNDNYQLGNGSYKTTPAQVSGVQVTNVSTLDFDPVTQAKTVAAGASHALAVNKIDGSVWAWGLNTFGQLGIGVASGTRTSPVQVSGTDLSSGVVAVAAGNSHSLALKSGGTLWAWGLNTSGQLGDGTTSQKNAPVPVSTAGITGTVIAVTAGSNHSLALTDAGTVWAWGMNTNGQLGDGTVTSPRTTAVQVTESGGGNLTNVKAIAAAGSFSIALKNDGTVWAWGYNNYGQLGVDPVTTYRATAAQVANLPIIGIKTVAAGSTSGSGGGSFSLAVDIDGNVWAWGSNNSGQLGNSSLINSTTPVQVLTGDLTNITGVTTIAASGNFALAQKSNGTVWAWGLNHTGQLGVDPVATPYRTTADQVSGLSGINFVAAGTTSPVAGGSSFSLAAKPDGTLFTWGDNSKGQLGSGSSLVSIPAQNLMFGVKYPLYYPSPGTITSFKLDAGATANWDTISWNGTTPANTSIQFETRGADTEAGLSGATWSSSYNTSSGSTITTPASRWLQIRLTEQSSDNKYTPMLNDFTITLHP